MERLEIAELGVGFKPIEGLGNAVQRGFAKALWGARKIRELLVRKLAGDVRLPAKSTVHAVLDRHGLVKHARQRKSRAEGTPLSAGVEPNALWLVAFTVLFILGAVNLSLVRSKADRECDTRPGPFSSGFNAGFQTASCECSPFFHFAEACPMPATLLPPGFAPAL